MLSALDEAVNTLDGRADTGALLRARAVADRAGERLRLSGEHTVVALAGSTGSGKSSLFNALAGEELSPVGVRRPTTSKAHACVWGSEGATALVQWLGVPRRQTSWRHGSGDTTGTDPVRQVARRGRARGPGAARPARPRLDGDGAPARGRPAGGAGGPAGVGGRPAEVRRPGAARALPAPAGGALRGHGGGAQPGRHGEPVRRGGVCRGLAPPARRRRPAQVAGADHFGADRRRAGRTSRAAGRRGLAPPGAQRPAGRRRRARDRGPHARGLGRRPTRGRGRGARPPGRGAGVGRGGADDRQGGRGLVAAARRRVAGLAADPLGAQAASRPVAPAAPAVRGAARGAGHGALVGPGAQSCPAGTGRHRAATGVRRCRRTGCRSRGRGRCGPLLRVPPATYEMLSTAPSSGPTSASIAHRSGGAPRRSCSGCS